MSLLKLPLEVMREIIEESIPEGFESFMMSCRAVYECGRYLIYGYMTRKRQFGELRFSLIAMDSSIYLDCLYRIAREPILARYVRKANLDWANRDPPQPFDAEDGPSDEAEATERVKKFVSESPYLRRAGVDAEVWARDMFPEQDALYRGGLKSRSLAVVFFLTLLPNVKTLALPMDWNFYAELTQTLAVMEAIVLMVQQNVRGTSLGNLSMMEIRVRYGYRERKDHVDLPRVLPFLGMPNLDVRIVCCLDEDDRAHIWRRPHVESGPWGITLRRKRMRDSDISTLLSYAPDLRTFRVNHIQRYMKVGYIHRSDPFRAQLVDTIGKQVGSHLEELGMAMESHKNESALVLEEANGITCMDEFVSLKKLDVDIWVFCSSINRTTADDPWVGASKPLVEILPPSLERLRIFVDPYRYKLISADAVRRLFEGFAAGRSKYLPNLKDVCVQCNSNHSTRAFDDIRACVEAEGARLEFRVGLPPYWKDVPPSLIHRYKRYR